jgi:hypothetical protein
MSHALMTRNLIGSGILRPISLSYNIPSFPL